MIFKARHGMARLGLAWHGTAQQHVPQYGNWDKFSGQGTARPGRARYGLARRGRARQR